MVAKLDKVLTIKEIADLAGWSRKRMLRHMQRLNEEVGGMLLHNGGTAERPRYTATLSALQSVAPQWFSDPDTVAAQLEAMQAEIVRLKRIVEMHTARLSSAPPPV